MSCASRRVFGYGLVCLVVLKHSAAAVTDDELGPTVRGLIDSTCYSGGPYSDGKVSPAYH
jgi:hypothetical protein